MLYLCATPIGNLEDITLRVLRVLSEADAVWAEDTRRTLNLLNHFEIKKPLISYHAHNIKEREALFTEKMREGHTIAYCSDAGMPGISDPGAALVSLCVKHDFPVTVLPGASAALASAVISGLDCSRFSFIGFLERDNKRRRATLELIRESAFMAVIYESPNRVLSTLKVLRDVLGQNRKAALIRELTKLHEQTARGTLMELCEIFKDGVKGEVVIVVEAKENTPKNPDTDAIDKSISRLIDSGFSPKDAAQALSAITGTPKNIAYKRALLINNRE